MKIQTIPAAFVALCQSASAIILYGAGNDTNRTDPGTGLPFDTVARVASIPNGDGTGGSGVHLGGGYMLTAAHIFESELNSVTFDGSTFYSRDLSYMPERVGDTDMKVFKLNPTPTVGSASIYTVSSATLYTGSSELLNEGYLVGWGRGRVEGSALNADTVPIAGGGTDLVKRWGTNDPNRTIPVFTYTSASVTYTFDALETTMGNTSGNPNDDGTGAFEAAATPRDSGSAMFQNIGGTWYLTGLTSLILQQTPGNVTFGNDVPWDGSTPSEYTAPGGAGDPNVFVRVSPYSTDIYALIPEPSALLLTSPALLLLLRRRRCDTRH